MKNSETERPSRKHDLIGNSIASPEGLDISPRIPTNCKKLDVLPRAPEALIIKIGFLCSASILAFKSFSTFFKTPVSLSPHTATTC